MVNENAEKKKQKQLIEALEKSSDEQVISMLIDLKEHGELFYLEPLLNMMIGERGDTLKRSLLEFISDIKVQEAVPIISRFTSSQAGKEGLAPLLTACWQSRLDFSQHLSPYFNILFEEAYPEAFEAFTVIENNVDGLTSEQLELYIKQTNSQLEKSETEKKTLLQELLNILEQTKRAAQ